MSTYAERRPSAIEDIEPDRLLDFRPGADMWWEITKTSAGTSGEYLETINHIGPSRGGPPIHVHQTAPESFDVLDGRLNVFLGDTWTALQAGQSMAVPIGTPHTVKHPQPAEKPLNGAASRVPVDIMGRLSNPRVLEGWRALAA